MVAASEFASISTESLATISEPDTLTLAVALAPSKPVYALSLKYSLTILTENHGKSVPSGTNGSSDILSRILIKRSTPRVLIHFSQIGSNN